MISANAPQATAGRDILEHSHYLTIQPTSGECVIFSKACIGPLPGGGIFTLQRILGHGNFTITAIPRGFIGAEFIPNGNSVVTEVGSWSQLASMLKYDRIDAAVIPELMVYDVFGSEVIDVYLQLAGRLPVSLYLSEFSQSNGVASEVFDAVEACRIDNPVSLITSCDKRGTKRGLLTKKGYDENRVAPTFQVLKKPDSCEPGFINTGSKGRSRTADPSIMSAVL